MGKLGDILSPVSLPSPAGSAVSPPENEKSKHEFDFEEISGDESPVMVYSTQLEVEAISSDEDDTDHVGGGEDMEISDEDTIRDNIIELNVKQVTKDYHVPYPPMGLPALPPVPPSYPPPLPPPIGYYQQEASYPHPPEYPPPPLPPSPSLPLLFKEAEAKGNILFAVETMESSASTHHQGTPGADHIIPGTRAAGTDTVQGRGQEAGGELRLSRLGRVLGEEGQRGKLRNVRVHVHVYVGCYDR